MRAWAYKAGASGLAMTIAAGGILAVTEIGRHGGPLPGTPPVAGGPPPARVTGSTAPPREPRPHATASQPPAGGNAPTGPRLVAAVAPSPQAGTPAVSRSPAPSAPASPSAAPPSSEPPPGPPGTPEPPGPPGSPTPAQCLLTVNVIGVTACVPRQIGD